MLANGRSLVKGIISQENMKKKTYGILSRGDSGFSDTINFLRCAYGCLFPTVITEAQWKICICESTLQWLADFHNRETLETDWRRDLRQKFSITIHPLKSIASEPPLSSDHFQSTALRLQAGHREATCCCAHKGTMEGNSSVQVLCWNQGTQTYIFQKQKSGMKEPLKVFPLGNWQKTYNQSGGTEKPIWYKRISITLGMRNCSDEVIDQLESNAGVPDMEVEMDTLQITTSWLRKQMV